MQVLAHATPTRGCASCHLFLNLPSAFTLQDVTPYLEIYLDPGPSVTLVMVILDDSSLRQYGAHLGGGALMISCRDDGSISEVRADSLLH